MRFELNNFLVLETLSKTPECFFNGNKIPGVMKVVTGVTKVLLIVDDSFEFDEEVLKENNILIKREING